MHLIGGDAGAYGKGKTIVRPVMYQPHAESGEDRRSGRFCRGRGFAGSKILRSHQSLLLVHRETCAEPRSNRVVGLESDSLARYADRAGVVNRSQWQGPVVRSEGEALHARAPRNLFVGRKHVNAEVWATSRSEIVAWWKSVLRVAVPRRLESHRVGHSAARIQCASQNQRKRRRAPISLHAVADVPIESVLSEYPQHPD